MGSALERRGEPLWVLILIGWMAAQAARRWPRDPPAPDMQASEAPGVDLLTAAPRELRALPGVGEVKALAIARERWKVRGTGRGLDLDALPGIGPKTSEAIQGGRVDVRDAAASSESEP